MTGRVGWVDAAGGISGDMLLGACLDAGAEPAAIQAALDRLQLPEPIAIDVERTRRGGLGAARAVVHVPTTKQHRTLADVLALLSDADAAAAAGVAVTLGPGGALLVEGAGAPLVVPAPAASTSTSAHG